MMSNNQFLKNLPKYRRITSKGRVATSGAHTSDVNGTPVGTKIVLTCIKYRI